jgi:hypothetical protein
LEGLLRVRPFPLEWMPFTSFLPFCAGGFGACFFLPRPFGALLSGLVAFDDSAELFFFFDALVFARVDAFFGGTELVSSFVTADSESFELLDGFARFFRAVLAPAGFFKAAFPRDTFASEGLVAFDDDASELCFVILGRPLARLAFLGSEDDSFDTEFDDGASELCFVVLGRPFARLAFFGSEDDSFDTEFDDDDASELCFFFLGRPFARLAFFGSEDDSFDTESSSELLVDADDDDE